VKVFEHEQRWSALTQSHDEPQYLLEETAGRYLPNPVPAREELRQLLRAYASQPIHFGGAELRVQPPQDLDQRAMGEPATAQVYAPPDRDRPASAGRTNDQLLHQPGLANTGVAGKNRDPASSGVGH
jgi:hypothetical protein